MSSHIYAYIQRKLPPSLKYRFGSLSLDETESIHQALLTYCHQDTLAMVKLHEVLLSEALQIA